MMTSPAPEEVDADGADAPRPLDENLDSIVLRTIVTPAAELGRLVQSMTTQYR
jgi:hypothetical protein